MKYKNNKKQHQKSSKIQIMITFFSKIRKLKKSI